MLQAGGLRVPFLIRSLYFSVVLILPDATMTLGTTQPLTEMSTRYLSRCKEWLEHKTDNLTAICEPNV
jgi:hypothetical protein